MWAIRHKPSGFFIPVVKGRKGSRAEPTENCIPRLFTKERHAKGYLTTWLQGIVVVGMHTDWETGISEEDWNVIHQEHRKREDMEIVPISLSIMESGYD